MESEDQDGQGEDQAAGRALLDAHGQQPRPARSKSTLPRGYHVPVFGRPLLIEDPDEIKFFSQVARFYRGALSEEETS